LAPTGRVEVENVAWPLEPTVPLPSEVVEPQVLEVQLLKITVPAGPEGSPLALASVTVAVKVTADPDVEVFPGDADARLIVVASVYWALPE
jgi:hypothetical protein